MGFKPAPEEFERGRINKRNSFAIPDAVTSILAIGIILGESKVPVAGREYTVFTNTNNVFGRAAYRADLGPVRYLGSFNDVATCKVACDKYRGPVSQETCRSFAFHQPDMVDPDPRSFRTLCYGVVDNSWLSHTEINVTSGIAKIPNCTTDDDCSLNGHCTEGSCECLAAWTGTDCGILQVLPATKGAGLHAPFGGSENTSSWGGSVAYDEATGRWIMFAAEMVGSCGINAWEQNSRIVRASAASPGGTYSVEAEIKPAFAHEPVLAKLEDGRWLLYSIGGPQSSRGPQSGCSEGYTPGRRSRETDARFSGPVPVTIFVSPSLTGNWTPLAHPIGEGDINPAPFVWPNGTTVMMHREPGRDWFRIHLARAKIWNGTYSYNTTGTIFPGFDDHGIEDPFVYIQPHPWGIKNVTYHAIFHDHKTFGGHAFSRDGVSWTYSTTVPYSNVINYSDGDSILLQRRERPHLIFNSEGYISHITNGVQPPPRPDKKPPGSTFANDYTYTLVQPVKVGPEAQQKPNST